MLKFDASVLRARWRVAAVQMKFAGTVAGNLDKIERAIRNAARRRADVVLFPCGDPPKSGPLVMLVCGPKKTQIMKGKNHTTEQKIRILREADGGKSIVEVSKEHNISEVTFHRWKRQFGQLDVNEARRMKELERENAELKKMLADSLLKNRVLEAVNAKKW